MRELRGKQCVVLLAALMVLGAVRMRSVDSQEGSKDILVVKSEEVIDRSNEQSGGGRAGSKPSVAKPHRNVTYRSSKPFTIVPPPPTMEYAQVGVTIWRLLKQDGSDPQTCEEAQLLQQVEGGAPLGIGSMVRIGIEPLTHDGFLYVIDREQFADGTYGTTQLIFPTARTRNGNNWILKDELVLIPKPSCFRINPSKTGKTQIAEELTYILSPTPIQLPAPLVEKAMPLTDTVFKSWETKWSASINVLEMNIGAGTTTAVKAQAEGVKSLDDVQDAKQLTEEDPLPRTIYRATIRRGSAFLVTVPLRFKGTAAPVENKEP